MTREPERRVGLVTGGSRGIGSATVRALAAHGFDVAFTYLSRARRAGQVVADVRASGREALAVAGDMTDPSALAQLLGTLGAWTDHLDVLVLNASGGLERDRLAEDPDYPMHINRDAQLALFELALPLLGAGSTVVFVTSHWAHLYGRVSQLPAYEPIARSKHAGEQALRERMAGHPHLRLLVVTGDLVQGTVTPKLLERAARGLTDQRRLDAGALPTAEEVGGAIAAAALDPTLPTGHTVVIGGELDSLGEF